MEHIKRAKKKNSQTVFSNHSVSNDGDIFILEPGFSA